MTVRFIDRAWNYLQREKHRKRLEAYADNIGGPLVITVPAPAAQGYAFDVSAWLPYQAVSLTAHTASGAATATVRIDGVAVDGLTNVSITTTSATHATTGHNSVAPGNRVTLDVLTTTSAAGISATLNRGTVPNGAAGGFSSGFSGGFDV